MSLSCLQVLERHGCSMKNYSRISFIAVGAAVIGVACFIITKLGVLSLLMEGICELAVDIKMPVFAYYSKADTTEDKSIGESIFDELYPVEEYYSMAQADNDRVIDAIGYHVNEDKYNGETTGIVINATTENTTTSAETQTEKNSEEQTTSEPSQPNEVTNVISRDVITGNTYDRNNLNDYNYCRRFYTVTSVTSLTESIFRPSEFLDKNLSIGHNAETPQILIFHTHSQEGFVNSVEGDDSTTILGVGDYLTSVLQDKYGYNVIHDRSIYDYVNGKLDRSEAYTYAENAIAKILEANPSIEVVIDLHRDGVGEDTHLVTDIDGKKTAKIMFFNGISYSNVKGDIKYLYNPFRDDNLAMSLQMHLLGEAYYPGWLRNIYINAYRYCLHERGKSMLIEAGAQTNTVEEVKNAMEPLADILDKLLRGEKVY